jgi:hypothetical protein
MYFVKGNEKHPQCDAVFTNDGICSIICRGGEGRRDGRWGMLMDQWRCVGVEMTQSDDSAAGKRSGDGTTSERSVVILEECVRSPVPTWICAGRGRGRSNLCAEFHSRDKGLTDRLGKREGEKGKPRVGGQAHTAWFGSVLSRAPATSLRTAPAIVALVSTACESPSNAVPASVGCSHLP